MTAFDGLGYFPDDGLPLWLVAGQVFTHDEFHPSSVWPAGATASIVFANGITWAGTITGNKIAWRIEPAASTAAIIPDRTRYSMKLTFPREGGGTDPYTWFGGTVVRSDLP